MNKIISLDIGRTEKDRFVMVFENGTLQNSLQIPCDYSMEDIVMLVIDECTSENNEIICSKYGAGLYFWDTFNTVMTKCMTPPNIIKNDKIGLFHSPQDFIWLTKNNMFAKKLFKLLGKNHNNVYIGYECNKLIDSYAEITFQVSEGGRVKLDSSNCKGINRLTCYLLALESLDSSR